MKRIGAREFLRRINDMNEPVEVQTHSKFKGVWIPADRWTQEDFLKIYTAILNPQPEEKPETGGNPA